MLLLFWQHKVKYYSYLSFVDGEQKHTGTGRAVACDPASLDKTVTSCLCFSSKEISPGEKNVVRISSVSLLELDVIMDVHINEKVHTSCFALDAS